MLSLFAAAHAQPTTIAHRGFSAVAPENTMAAFEAAADLGVGFELDVTLSKDGEVVVLHDDTARGEDEELSATIQELRRGGARPVGVVRTRPALRTA